MTDHVFKTDPLASAIRRYMDGADRSSAVRCYRSSPERVTLQIRTNKASFATVDLPLGVTHALANALLNEVIGS